MRSRRVQSWRATCAQRRQEYVRRGPTHKRQLEYLQAILKEQDVAATAQA